MMVSMDDPAIGENDRLLDIHDMDMDVVTSDQYRKLDTWTVVRIGLILVTLLLIVSGFCLLAPFFPNEARKKGLDDTQIAIIFTSYQVAVLVMSPIYGMLVSCYSSW